jgi:hypothetical protein
VREARHKVLWIPAELMLRFLQSLKVNWSKGSKIEIPSVILDPDTVVMNSCHDWARQSIGFLLYNPGWDVVPPGHEPPGIYPGVEYEVADAPTVLTRVQGTDSWSQGP